MYRSCCSLVAAAPAIPQFQLQGILLYSRAFLRSSSSSISKASLIGRPSGSAAFGGAAPLIRPFFSAASSSSTAQVEAATRADYRMGQQQEITLCNHFSRNVENVL